jgi:hypothetical protein
MDVAFGPDGTRLDPAVVDGCMKVWNDISDRDTIPIPAAPKTRSPDVLRASVGSTDAPNRLLDTSVCRTEAR